MHTVFSKTKLQKIVDYDRITIFVILVFAFILFLYATLAPLRYDEIDSNALPLISLQYRGSIVCCQEDIQQAKIDFPNLYQNVNSYDDLRCSKLVKATDDVWRSYYFPIYPAFCIPVKLLLSFLGLNQERTFSITNALLVITALYTIYKYLNVSDKTKLFIILLLICSPIIFYVNYLNYETFMFSMVTISMVFYYIGYRKRSALFLSLAGMSNSAIMAVGMVMILYWLFSILWQGRKQKFIDLFINNIKDAVSYAICFLPCFIPFIYKSYFGGTTYSSITTMSDVYGIRFLSYMFDPTLGFPTFAPLQILCFCIIFIYFIIKRNFDMITKGTFVLSAVAGASSIFHINCGMIFCSRYLIWIYPVLAFYIAVGVAKVINKQYLLNVLKISVIIISCILINCNNCHPFYFNLTSRLLLNYCPAIYNPYVATFNCRTLHIDGGYIIDRPIIYTSDDGYVRKILIPPGCLEQCEELLVISDEDRLRFNKEISKVKTNEKYYYLNFGVGTHIVKRPPNYNIGEVSYFDNSSQDAHKFFSGMSITENGFAWTDGNEIELKLSFSEEISDNILLEINLLGIYKPPKRLIVECNGDVIFDKYIENTKPICISIPKKYIQNRILELKFDLPDVISQLNSQQSSENRLLGLAIQSFVINYDM